MSGETYRGFLDDGPLSALVQHMERLGAGRVYAKRLSPNDNSKNQIFLGQGDTTAANLIPNEGPVPVPGKDPPILKSVVVFSWLLPDGGLEDAPATQLILYPQYPEVRMSGFLKGCRRAPSVLLASRAPGRVLFFGIRTDGQVLGYLSAPGTALSREVEEFKDPEKVGVFLRMPVGGAGDLSSRDLLLRELGRIHRLGWIDSKRLDSEGTVMPCEAPQCGGYTLEAELGVRPQGKAEPDFHGWEIKQHEVGSFERLHSGGPLTLFTPEPTRGVYSEKGPEFFVREYGYPDKMGRPDRLNFGGVHVVGMRQPTTKLTLTLRGFDIPTGKLLSVADGIALVADDGTIAAEWGYLDLMKHWQRKHAQAAYVPSMKRMNPLRQYHYGPVVHLGEGTDFLQLLGAFASGQVYYDPGIKVEDASSPKPRVKRRSQFRVRSRGLASLYGTFQEVAL